MTEKADKKKISDELNKILDIRVDFTKLSIKELRDFYDVFITPTKLTQVIGRATKSRIENKVMDMNLQEMVTGQGPLGLGILPKFTKGLNFPILKQKTKSEEHEETSEQNVE